MMSSDRTEFLEDDPRVLQISREYLSELESGRQPDRQAFLNRYPELTAALAECLDGIDLAQSLRPAVSISQPAPEFTATPLGDFQIRREIGRGGMGIVYEATQLSLGRRVALKVLPFASALDAKHLQRFKNEATAAAQLHHPNIVPVYGVGCDRGVHYYAMQLIEGRSLSAMIRELRGGGPDDPSSTALSSTAAIHASATLANSRITTTTLHSGRSRESFRAAARIAAQIADALEYAHDAGIVHRDIKPANILLDSRGAVWITDFGLAQVAADVSLTQSGDLVGTLRYMSPEQASGKRVPVDHRADVYSLGASLYELLTLQPMFDGQDRPTLLMQILNEEPRSLRQIDRAIPVELETIVLKAIAKDPVERYATAGEMAADLRRFLDERPILARRPTLVDRGRKWMRRHPAVVVAALLFLGCGIIGSMVTTALISREHVATKSAYFRESQRAAEAESRFQLARRAADEMIEMAEEDLSDNPFQVSLRKRMLETALEYYQKFIDQRSQQPNAQLELALTHDRVKNILSDLAVLQADREHYLLRETAVLDDLQATADQRSRLSELIRRQGEQRRTAFREIQVLSPEARQQRSLQVARANEAELAEILNADQLRRLGQIALQCQVRALREPDVARRLNLTPKQRDQLREIEAEASGTRSRSPFGKVSSQQSQRFDERMRAAGQRMLEVLTTEQRAQWEAMIGPPYNGPKFFHGHRF